ncbi:MAG: 4Fe-4S binding protein [Bacteroidales bacterium]|jgi:NADH:ubiquinone oxidoreductase subunit F (NADH-binding)/Pyruvate/2-oxoacid:ferredoxin oxidoreductase delta subunit/(2Fe-2S) ferredoxin|nr:4Fe-4S binding protein [Bacteroidales bacterium]
MAAEIKQRTDMLIALLRGDQKNDTQKELSIIKREVIDKPVIYIGAGTCGLGAGAGETIIAVKDYLTAKKIDATIMEVGCIGLCKAEPIVDVQLPGKNRVSFRNVTSDKVEDVLNAAFTDDAKSQRTIGQIAIANNTAWSGIEDFYKHPFFISQKRIVLKNCGLIDPESIEEYIAFGGYRNLLTTISSCNGAEVCDIMEKSGLRGRGGGGFATGKKWKIAQSQNSEQKYLICNADEGDPGAFMDRAVIEGDPHRLIEGMAIGAYAIGASIGYVYIRAEYPLAIKRLKIAIAKAKEYGLLGKNIFGTGFDFELKIKMGAGAFVCGEETALINSIEGKRGMPRPRPPFPPVSGLFGKPTVINNVETFANVPEIMGKGWEWFSSIGTATSKGTKVFALSGKIFNTGLVEIPMGTTIRHILFDIAGGIANGKKFKAVQIGGPSGGCITEQNLDIQIDYESLLKVGAMMGSGGLVVMDEDNCMVDVAKFFMDFIQRESCGKCIPCREGTRRMLEILESITTKPVHNGENSALERMKGVMQLEKLGQVIKDTSLCGLGQSAPNPVLSTLKWFRHEYEEHIFERSCSTRICTELRKYKIHADACTGCGLCAKKCPVSAIIGSKKAPHFIVDEKCIGCGSCIETCNFKAVEMI